jgi:hypothetical protein
MAKSPPGPLPESTGWPAITSLRYLSILGSPGAPLDKTSCLRKNARSIVIDPRESKEEAMRRRLVLCAGISLATLLAVGGVGRGAAGGIGQADGRAATIREAIQAHDGQGAPARNAFNALPAGHQRALIKFVNSL